MSGFKIKPPKKPRKPSAKFLARKAEQEAARRETPPTEGGVRIYLDDERVPPEGWTLVKSVTALMEMLRTLEPGRLERLSLEEVLLEIADVVVDGRIGVPFVDLAHAALDDLVAQSL